MLRLNRTLSIQNDVFSKIPKERLRIPGQGGPGGGGSPAPPPVPDEADVSFLATDAKTTTRASSSTAGAEGGDDAEAAEMAPWLFLDMKASRLALVGQEENGVLLFAHDGYAKATHVMK